MLRAGQRSGNLVDRGFGGIRLPAYPALQLKVYVRRAGKAKPHPAETPRSAQSKAHGAPTGAAQSGGHGPPYPARSRVRNLPASGHRSSTNASPEIAPTSQFEKKMRRSPCEMSMD